MKRTLDSNEPIRWIKTGGGSFRLFSGKIIKPGQRFTAPLTQIPKAFRDMVIPVDKEISMKDVTGSEAETPIEQVRKSELKIIQRSPGWFNVVNEQGKQLNENALRKDEAEELKKQLEE